MHKLTRDETAVLDKGLNYVVALERIPNDDFIVATELAAVKLIKQHPNRDPHAAELIAELGDIHQNRICPMMRGNRSVLWPKKKTYWSCWQIRARRRLLLTHSNTRIRSRLCWQLNVYKRLKRDPTRRKTRARSPWMSTETCTRHLTWSHGCMALRRSIGRETHCTQSQITQARWCTPPRKPLPTYLNP